MNLDVFAMGFAAAQRAAVRVCQEFAEELDFRTEQARTARVTAPRECRRLRQAASRIRDLSPEEGR